MRLPEFRRIFEQHAGLVVVQAATLQMHPLRRTERFRSAAAGFSVDSLSSIPVLRLRE